VNSLTGVRIPPSPPVFFQLFFGWYEKAIKKPNYFNIFQNHLRTYIAIDDVGCGEYRLKLAEIYGGSVTSTELF
jgi:hypothetical protein